MDLFKDLQNECCCYYISDLPKLWREERKAMARTIMTLTFRGYPLTQWYDLCNYLQVPFCEEELKTPMQVRTLFQHYLLVD